MRLKLYYKKDRATAFMGSFAMAKIPGELSQDDKDIFWGTKEQVRREAMKRGYDLNKIDIDYQYAGIKVDDDWIEKESE